MCVLMDLITSIQITKINLICGGRSQAGTGTVQKVGADGCPSNAQEGCFSLPNEINITNNKLRNTLPPKHPESRKKNFNDI